MRWPDDGENVKQNQTWTTISSAERSGKRFIYLYDTYKIYQIAVVFFFSPSNISFAFGSFWSASFKSRINHINLSVLRLLSQAKWTDQHFQYHFFLPLKIYNLTMLRPALPLMWWWSFYDGRAHTRILTHTHKQLKISLQVYFWFCFDSWQFSFSLEFQRKKKETTTGKQSANNKNFIHKIHLFQKNWRAFLMF